jgi:hypothetical protein
VNWKVRASFIKGLESEETSFRRGQKSVCGVGGGVSSGESGKNIEN